MHPLRAFVYYFLQSHVFEFVFRTFNDFMCDMDHDALLHAALLYLEDYPDRKEVDASQLALRCLQIVDVWQNWAPYFAFLIRLFLFVRLGYRLFSYYFTEDEAHQAFPNEPAGAIPEAAAQAIPEQAAQGGPNEAAHINLDEVTQTTSGEVAQVTSTSAPGGQFITILAYAHSEQLDRRVRTLEDRLEELLAEEGDATEPEQ